MVTRRFFHIGEGLAGGGVSPPEVRKGVPVEASGWMIYKDRENITVVSIVCNLAKHFSIQALHPQVLLLPW